MVMCSQRRSQDPKVHPRIQARTLLEVQAMPELLGSWPGSHAFFGGLGLGPGTIYSSRAQADKKDGGCKLSIFLVR